MNKITIVKSLTRQKIRVFSFSIEQHENTTFVVCYCLALETWALYFSKKWKVYIFCQIYLKPIVCPYLSYEALDEEIPLPYSYFFRDHKEKIIVSLE